MRDKATLTFLFTDIECSTQLWERDPDRMDRSVHEHFVLLEELVEARDGEVFNRAGDSACAAFPNPVDAVAAAVTIQERLVVTQFAIGELRVRIGIHTGECWVRDGDYYGRTVNRVARIEDAGHGGQVLLSETTAELIETELDTRYSLRSLGTYRLTGIAAQERIYQLTGPGWRDDFPPLRTRPTGNDVVPAERTPLVGRETELARLEALVRSSNLVSIVGPPGVGKSRVAVRLASEHLVHGPREVHFIDLSSCRRESAAVDSVATALGVRRREGMSTTDSIVESLRSTPSLLVLDECEHMVGPVASLVTAIITSCPSASVVCTSRAVLGVDGERVWYLNPLDLPSADADRTAVAESPAIQLFVDAATRARPDFALDDDNGPLIADICRRLDGLPFAIELAASRVDTMTPAELHRTIDELLTDLTKVSIGLGDALHEALSALTRDERTVFDHLAAFAGPATSEALARICALEVHAADAAITGLVHRSMVVVVQEDETRYRLLSAVRQFAYEQGSVTDDVKQRHATYFIDRAEELGERYIGPDAIEASRALACEFDDHRLAFHRSRDRRRWHEASRLIRSLHTFCVFSMRPEVYEWIETILERDHDEDHADLLGLLALGWWLRGDPHQAIRCAERSIDADPGSSIWARTALLNATGFLGDLDRALEVGAELVAECVATGLPFWRVNAFAYEAVGMAAAGDLPRALTAAKRAVVTADESGNTNCVYWACFALAVASDEDTAALAALERAYTSAQAVGSRANEAIVLMEMVSRLRSRGRLGDAASASLELFERLVRSGVRSQLWQAVFDAALVLLDAGLAAAAAELLAAVDGQPRMPRAGDSDVLSSADARLTDLLDADHRAEIEARGRLASVAEITDRCRDELRALVAAC